MQRGFLVFSLLVVLSKCLIFPIPIPTFFYYAYWFFVAIIISLKGVILSQKMSLFVILSALSIVFNNIDPVFKSEYRFISFCLMITAIGPLNNSRLSLIFRYKLFICLTKILILMVTVSAVLWVSKIPLFFHPNGLYKGLFVHSMMLGPFSAFSAVICLQFFLSVKFRKQKYKYGFLFILSMISTLLAGSRGALISLFIGVVFVIYLYCKNNIYKFLKITLAISLGLMLSFPLWFPLTENVRMKQEASIETGGLMSSREVLWNDRINEFKNSPLVGSGFAAMNLQNIVVDKFDSDTGGVEPGSSWLFLLSSVGLFGFLSFLSITVFPFVRSLKMKNKLHSVNVTLILIVFCFFIHMSGEGYILSSGSFLFFYFWLSISLLQCSYSDKLILSQKSLFKIDD